MISLILQIVKHKCCIVVHGAIMLPALTVNMFNVIFNECHYVECNYAWCHLLSIVMLSVVPPNAV